MAAPKTKRNLTIAAVATLALAAPMCSPFGGTSSGGSASSNDDDASADATSTNGDGAVSTDATATEAGTADATSWDAAVGPTSEPDAGQAAVAALGTLTLWFDAADTSSITIVGAAVTAWTDRAHNVTATHGTASGTPIKLSTNGGHAVLTFAAGDYLVGPPGVEYDRAAGSPFSISIIATHDSSPGYFFSTAGAAGSGYGLWTTGSDVCTDLGGATGCVGDQSTSVLGENVFEYTGTSNIFGGHMNSDDVETDASFLPGPGFTIGAQHASGSAVLTGDIAEIVLLTGPSSLSDTSVVSAYLKAKYGL